MACPHRRQFKFSPCPGDKSHGDILSPVWMRLKSFGCQNVTTCNHKDGAQT